MPHNWRTLVHERASIFKCEQQAVNDHRGPENNFFVIMWSIIDIIDI